MFDKNGLYNYVSKLKSSLQIRDPEAYQNTLKGWTTGTDESLGMVDGSVL